ncbi:DUF4352 domain-containing protein [Algibacter sp. Ld11]|uniref:DUF4352 domain-containing protein n=1 Tax=Algibacter sp. Ld11 TaxID=649150 RepID=UPI003864460C
MKRLFLILLLFPFILFSQVKVDYRIKHKISEDYELQIFSLKKQRGIDVSMTGSGGTIYEKAKKGYQYIELMIKIKNISNSKKIVDFNKFQIVDKNSNIYETYLCVGNGLNKKKCEDYEFKLKPNKKRLARINFKPLIPKNVEIKHIRFNGVNVVSF